MLNNFDYRVIIVIIIIALVATYYQFYMVLSYVTLGVLILTAVVSHITGVELTLSKASEKAIEREKKKLYKEYDSQIKANDDKRARTSLLKNEIASEDN